MRDVLGGEFWGAAAYLLVALLAVLAILPLFGTPQQPARPESIVAQPESLVEAVVEVERNADPESTLPPVASPPPRVRPTPVPPPRVSAIPEPSKLSKTMARLCRNPALEDAGLAPDCESGLVTLTRSRHFPPASNELTDAAKTRLRKTIPVWVQALREEDLLEPGQLESIEIRGHADPYARKDPYAANLWRSQQRALALATFLTGDEALAEDDRAALRPLLVASGASFSRPPASCPKPEAECLDDWRRLEIVLHPVD